MTDPLAEWRRLCLETATNKLAATLRPDPESRRRRFAQFSVERLARYLKANEGLV
jgi:hypothetical protein